VFLIGTVLRKQLSMKNCVLEREFINDQSHTYTVPHGGNILVCGLIAFDTRYLF
jgi:hypothetical protein